MLLLTIGLAFSLESDILYGLIEDKAIDPWKLAASLCLGAALFYFFFRRIKNADHSLAKKITSLFNGLSEGFLTIVHMEKKWAYLFHTVFIWIMYVAMFYMIKFSLPETQDLGFEPLLIGFIVGAFAISATNGGIGIYPFSVSLVLISYGITKESSLAFGWIMWTAQTVMVIFFGSLSFLLLPLVNRKK